MASAKPKRRLFAALLSLRNALVAALLVWSSSAAAQYEFKGNYPTPQTTQRVRDDADFQRAMTAYRFWYPTVSTEGVFNGIREVGVLDNQSMMIGAVSPHAVVFTASSDAPCASAVLDLTDGPWVVDLPPGRFTGQVNDHHQGWVLDMGLAGPDAGRGGKHLILPPGYKGKVPFGHYAGRSSSFKVLVVVRSLPVDGDAKHALDALRAIKIYPLSAAAKPEPIKAIDMTDRNLDTTSLRWEDNVQFWKVLHRITDAEPLVPSFLPMYGLLAGLGIERGRPFNPDARMKAILGQVAKAGRDQLLVSAFDSTRPDRINWPDRKWEWLGLVTGNPQFETATGVDLEARDRWFAQAIVTSPAVFRRTAGAGVLYWMTVRDGTGAFLDGGKNYKLSIPQPVPAKLFWSVTIYDTATRSQVQTDQDRASLRSMFELKDVPASASVDVFVGPMPPMGKETHWIKTTPGRGWFAYIRVYGPEQAAFDQSWEPGDFEEVKPAAIGATSRADTP